MQVDKDAFIDLFSVFCSAWQTSFTFSASVWLLINLSTYPSSNLTSIQLSHCICLHPLNCLFITFFAYTHKFILTLSAVISLASPYLSWEISCYDLYKKSVRKLVAIIPTKSVMFFICHKGAGCKKGGHRSRGGPTSWLPTCHVASVARYELNTDEEPPHCYWQWRNYDPLVWQPKVNFVDKYSAKKRWKQLRLSFWRVAKCCFFTSSDSFVHTSSRVRRGAISDLSSELSAKAFLLGFYVRKWKLVHQMGGR